jgi:hypothetical protein
MVDLDYFSNEEIERHPYYQDFLGRFGLRWSAVVRIAPSSASTIRGSQLRTGRFQMRSRRP